MPDSKDEKFDAIIVGAGPSGCSCALFLARKGRKVLLVDKAKFPREKICGDAVSGKSINILRELGLLSKVQGEMHGTVNGVKMVSPSGKEVTVPFPKAAGLDCAGYCLPRMETDNILMEAARKEKNIALIENFAVEALIKDGTGKVIGVRGKKQGVAQAGGKGIGGENNSEEKTFHARVVVGADGAGSIVARNAGLAGVPPEHTYVAIRGYWKGVSGLSDNIELFFIDEVLPGYLWIFPMGDGTANVGLGILASDMKKKKIQPNTILLSAIGKSPMLKERFTSANLKGKIGAWTIPLGSHKRKLCGNGWLVAGDAASLVDPFSGEGFGNAVSSGKFAANAIDSALALKKTYGQLEEKDLFGYGEAVRKELYPEMDTTYKLQRASRFRFLLDMFISKAASKPEVRQMVIDMLASNEEKNKVQDPIFYIKLLLF